VKYLVVVSGEAQLSCDLQLYPQLQMLASLDRLHLFNCTRASWYLLYLDLHAPRRDLLLLIVCCLKAYVDTQPLCYQHIHVYWLTGACTSWMYTGAWRTVQAR
jgi:hypothetical protein